MTENIYVEYNGETLTLPREIPLRVFRSMGKIEKLLNAKTEEELAENPEDAMEVFEESNKLLDYYAKWNPQLKDTIDDMGAQSLYKVFGEWSKKVQAGN